MMSLPGQSKMVQCRVCKGDHWTTKCPYKDTLQPLQDSLTGGGETAPPADATDGGAGGRTTGGKYVPPSLRGGTGQRREGESMKTRGKLHSSKGSPSTTATYNN